MRRNLGYKYNQQPTIRVTVTNVLHLGHCVNVFNSLFILKKQKTEYLKNIEIVYALYVCMHTFNVIYYI